MCLPANDMVVARVQVADFEKGELEVVSVGFALLGEKLAKLLVSSMTSSHVVRPALPYPLAPVRAAYIVGTNLFGLLLEA